MKRAFVDDADDCAYPPTKRNRPFHDKSDQMEDNVKNAFKFAPLRFDPMKPFEAAFPTPPPSAASAVVSVYPNCWSHRLSPQKFVVPDPAPTNVRVGRGTLAQFCGSISLIWLNPWFHAKMVLDGHCLPTTLSPLSHPSRLFLAYVERILNESDLSAQVVDLALLLICRFRSMSPHKPEVGKPGSELRIVVSALMVANKVLDDTSYSTAAWLQFSRLPVGELRTMETEFLQGLQYRTHVSRAQWTSWSQAARVLFRASDSIKFSL